MLPCVCSVIDYRWRQSVVGSRHTSSRRLCHWYFLPHFDVLCDLLLNRPTQHGIYLFYSMIKKVLRTTHNLHRTAWLFYGEICASLGIFKFPNATFRLSFFFSSISYLHTVSSNSFQRLHFPKAEKWPKYAAKQRASWRWHMMATDVKMSCSLGVLKLSRTLFVSVSPFFFFINSSC